MYQHVLKESEKNFGDTTPKIHFCKLREEKIRKEFNKPRHKFCKSKKMRLEEIFMK